MKTIIVLLIIAMLLIGIRFAMILELLQQGEQTKSGSK